MAKKVASKHSSKKVPKIKKKVKNTNKTAPKTKKAAKEPTINILKHTLVPKHTILKKTEVNTLLTKFNISLHQLPLIKAKDPVAKLIDAEPGDIIKIERTGPTKDYLFYRRVCE